MSVSLSSSGNAKVHEKWLVLVVEELGETVLHQQGL